MRRTLHPTPRAAVHCRVSVRNGRVETPDSRLYQSFEESSRVHRLQTLKTLRKTKKASGRSCSSSSLSYGSSPRQQDHDSRAQLLRLRQRHAVVRLRVHHLPGRGLQAHDPVPALPLHLHGGPAGERAGPVGELEPAPLRQRRSLLRHQREPVGPDGDCDHALLHHGGVHGQGVAVGPLPLQGHQPHLHDQLLQQLLLPGLHDHGALPGPDQALVPAAPPRGGPAPLGDLRRPVAPLFFPGPDRERARGPSGVGRARLLHAARAQLQRVVHLRVGPGPDLPVHRPRRRHHHLQPADRSGGESGAGCAGPAGRVAGARVLPGLRRVLAALPAGDVDDARGQPRPLHLQLQHHRDPLLLLQRGAVPLAVPHRRQPHPLQLPQPELPQQPDQHGAEPHTQRGGGADGRGKPARRRRRRPEEAAQAEQRQHQPVRRGVVRRKPRTESRPVSGTQAEVHLPPVPDSLRRLLRNRRVPVPLVIHFLF